MSNTSPEPEPFLTTTPGDAKAVPVPLPPSLEGRSQSQTIRSRATAKLQELGTSLRRFRAILRLHPFDTSTPEGRSNERYRRAALTTLTAMIAQALGIFTGLAWIRLSLSYLGEERYGLWIAIGSLLAWANLADMGLARGMQNHLSQANGQDDRELGARYVSTGLAALGSVALALGFLAAPVVLLFPWATFLNVRDPALVPETRQAVVAAVACFLLAFPFSIVPTIYAAYQRGYIASIFNILGSLVSLCTLIAATRFHLSLPWLIAATSGIGILMALVNFGYALKEMPWLLPRVHLVSWKTLRELGGTSGALFMFQIGALLINETACMIIARRLGLPQVTEWSIFLRVQMLPGIFIQMIDAPLIPAFREAYVRGERDWIKTAFWRVTKLKGAVALLATGLYFIVGNWAVQILSGQPIVFARDMWAGAAFLLVVAVWNGSFNDLLIATDRLRILVITLLANGLVTPILSYLLAPTFGLFGVLIAMPIFSLVVSAWLLPWACRDLLSAPVAVYQKAA
jgi:O-antigen/teichoic acid export membrane protein